jgi:hypothetical protein
MPRTLNDFSMQRVFPAPAKYPVNIISVEKGFSKNKRTPQITLVFSDGENEFDDQLFVTEKTIPRLCLVAKRVCLMDEKTELPDVDIDAANMVARFIMSNALGKKCIVRIEENEETIIIDNGPNIGQKKTIKRRRVAYNGYEKFVEREAGADDMPFPEQGAEPPPDDGCPF